MNPWIYHYQFFLFDFDGLLVDTEKLHYQSYSEMCARRGFQLTWTFAHYSSTAYHHSTGLRDSIYAELPALYNQEPNWQVLYAEKQQILTALLEKGNISLMPGVYALLKELQQADIKHCVVTHSSSKLIQGIKAQHPILNQIPYWITREDYQNPKPHSECYEMALAKWAKPNDRLIGFEDSPRGLSALLGTKIKPVLVCPSDAPYLTATLQAHPHLHYFPSFLDIKEGI